MKFNVKDKRFPKWENIEPKVTFVNDLKAIHAELQYAPELDEILKYSTGFLLSTWDRTGRHLDSKDNIKELPEVDREEAIKLLYRALRGKFLPTFLESIRVTFLLDGITMHAVTHLIRSRRFSFAAQCSGDSLLYDQPITIPDAIIDAGMEDRYKNVMTECMNMYCDLLNTHNVAVQDARMVLPRTITTFYYASFDMGEAIKVTKQRIDEQVQPKEDNILWMQIWLELCRKYKFLSTLFDFDIPNDFYIRESKTNFYSGFFEPNKQNQGKIEYEKGHFLFDCTRDKLYGNKTYNELKEQYRAELAKLQREAKEEFPFLYTEEYEAEYK